MVANPGELERIRSVGQAIDASFCDLTVDEFWSHPIAGKWSPAELLFHLADFDPIICERIKRMLAMDEPAILGADEDSFSARLSLSSRSMQVELDVIRSARMQIYHILNGVADSDLQRTGMHNERGRIDVIGHLQHLNNHALHHLRHMNEKRNKLGKPAVELPE